MNHLLKGLVLLMFFFNPCFAQLSFKGKLVSFHRDTLEGYIQIEEDQFCTVVKYKKNKEDRFEKIPLCTLYKIIVKERVYENLFFVKEDVQGGKIYTCKLCLCRVDGFVKLYEVSNTMFCTGYENSRAGARSKASRNEVFYVVKGESEAEEINKRCFEKQSLKTFNGYSFITSSIKEQKYRYNDIVRIVQNCNQAYYQVSSHE